MDEGLSELEWSALRVYLSASTKLLERLDHELQQRSGLSLTDFDILTELAQAPDRRLRMSELAQRVLVSRSRLTYRVDRLAKLQYVTRETAEEDRRGLFAILTDSGAETYQTAAKNHLDNLKRWFFDRIDHKDLETLGRIMRDIDDNLPDN